MDIQELNPIRPFLLVAAIVGFLAINVPFLYFALIDKATYAEAMRNGMALVFMGEALILMLLIAFLISRFKGVRPGWVFFVVMSLIGSLAFSIPLQLYLMTRSRRTGESTEPS